MTFGAESSQSGSHITIIIQNFTLISSIFTVTPQPVGLPLGAVISSLSIYLTLYILNFLCTHLFTHSTSHYYICIPAVGINLRLSTCWGMQFVIFDYCSMWQESWAISWMQSILLPYVVVSFVISISQSNWLDDKRLFSIYHQFDQSN